MINPNKIPKIFVGMQGYCGKSIKFGDRFILEIFEARLENT